MELARAYSRMGRDTEAVERYLQAWRADPDGEIGQRAERGLERLAGSLDRLAALQKISDQMDDPEIRAAADQRLERLAGTYDALDNGAEYLTQFPGGPWAEAVAVRLDDLAQRLYGEVVLYQGVGDSLKALERIQKILDYAPSSPAADRLREQVEAEAGA